ncbi:MAG: carboxypeptidase-like regulatory domain-containing protein, partial [Propionibacteriaceae bacterium]|nr:carboxypeptidase-like regulatory domain-containing protein [Propionibacteriaceae bacterium]
MSVAQAEGTPAATASPDSAAGMATPDEAVTPAASPVDDSTPVTVDSTPVAGATGSIAGTVTTQDGTALDGLTVTVFYVNAGVIDSGTTVAYSALTVDPASGAYSIDGLAPGTYAVVAYDDTHAATWVGGSTITIFQNGALTVDGHLIDIVTIPTAGGAVTGQDIALAPSPVITGTITPAVDGLTVQTCHVNNTGSSPYLDECGSFGVTVDASTGAYTVTRDGFGYPLNPGDQYVVGASATGYPFTWLGGYVSAGDRPGYSTVMAPVALPETNAPVTGADITLVKFASISGTVTATDPAVPLNASWSVAVCTIRLVWTGDCTQAASSNLDPVTGAYIIGGLLPDTDYIVYSTANRYLQTWYGGWSGTGPDLSDSSVTVTKVHTDAEGSDVADINIDLLAGAHITGTISGVPAHTSITLEVCTASGSGYSVSLSNCESHAYSNDSDVVADISYSLDVTPGRTLTISAKADRTLCGWVGGLTTSWCGGYYSGARVPTIITAPAAGGTLSSQDVALVTAGTITGTITLPQGYSTTGIGVNVYARSVDGRGDNPAVVSIWGSGEYTIGDAVPGVEYMVCASTFGYEGSSSSLTTAYGGWYGNSDPSQAKDGVTPVTVQGPGETVAHVDIAMVAGGTISGTVTLPAGYSLSGDRITVWAQPVGSASASSRAVSVEANHFDGGYGINNAMPGVTYVVYAYAGGSDLLTTGYGTWFGSYFSSDPLPDGLTPVTAESGERLTGVDIAMVAPAYITGQVLLPDGSPATSGYVACGPLAEYGRGWVPVNIAADGSYSCRAVPGRDYVVDASIPGYPKTWLGGRLGSVPALPADGVTAVTVGGPGATLSGQDITMGQGWSLSGVLTYDPDGVEYAGVAACAYDADGNYLDCEGTG